MKRMATLLALGASALISMGGGRRPTCRCGASTAHGAKPTRSTSASRTSSRFRAQPDRHVRCTDQARRRVNGVEPASPRAQTEKARDGIADYRRR